MFERPVGKIERPHGVASSAISDLLSLLEAMDTGSYDACSSAETSVDPNAASLPQRSATLRSDTVLAGRSTTQTKVSPSSVRTADADRRSTSLCNLLSVAVTVLPRRKLGGRINQGDANTAHRVDVIRLRRNLTNSAFDLNGGKQLQAYRKRQAGLQRDRKIWPDVDDGLSDIGPCYRNDSLPGRDDLSHIGADGRYNPGELGLQLREPSCSSALVKFACARATDAWAPARAYSASSKLAFVVDLLAISVRFRSSVAVAFASRALFRESSALAD